MHLERLELALHIVPSRKLLLDERLGVEERLAELLSELDVDWQVWVHLPDFDPQGEELPAVASFKDHRSRR